MKQVISINMVIPKTGTSLSINKQMSTEYEEWEETANLKAAMGLALAFDAIFILLLLIYTIAVIG